ncbi:shikimate kinase [Pontibacter ruber]|uniref:Shikimate kinase n=1 Tax=Pontibacter ruber TaxID=1343895 RepID=A0ABW5CVI6_9BACT|nr:shikimate kinase [Pontibacter ruber]
MRIFLVGMMGSGKTTLGRQLATQLGYTFVDLDEYIERREGKSIAQLFEQEGQEQFRLKERQALEAVVQEYDQAVIATGGGAPCFLDNMQFINRSGKSFFLDVPVEELVNRLLNSDLSVRPLLAGKSTEELNHFMTKTLSERLWFYRQAHYTLSGNIQTSEALLTLINYI